MIRRIRNAASHDMNPISFVRTDGIADRRRDLAAAKRLQEQLNDTNETPTVKQLFTTACEFYAILLAHRKNEAGPDFPEEYRCASAPLDL